MEKQITKTHKNILNKQKGFTLVELIIVITILAILATIAFISFKSYSWNARDGNRVTALSNIQKWLDIYQVKVWKYPHPDDVYGTGTFWGESLNYVWYISGSLSKVINMNKTPIDPKTQNNYVYWVSSNYQKYQLATTLEELEAGIVIPTTYAAQWKAKVVWNYTYPLRLGSKVYSLPSLIFVWTWDLLTNSTWFIVNNSGNLPYSLDGQLSNNVSVTEQLQQITGKENLTLTWISVWSYTSIESVTGSTAEQIAASLWVSVWDLGNILFPTTWSNNASKWFSVKFTNEDYKWSETTASWLGWQLSGSLMKTAQLKILSSSGWLSSPVYAESILSYNWKIIFIAEIWGVKGIYEYDGTNTIQLDFSSIVSPASVTYISGIKDLFNNKLVFWMNLSNWNRAAMTFNGTTFEELPLASNRSIPISVINNKLIYRNDADSLKLYSFDGMNNVKLSDKPIWDNVNPFYFCNGKYYFKLYETSWWDSRVYSYDGTNLVNVSGTIDMWRTYDIRWVCEWNILYFDTNTVSASSNLRSMPGHSALWWNPRTMKLNTDTNVIELYDSNTWLLEQKGQFNTVKYNNNYYSSQNFGDNFMKYDANHKNGENIVLWVNMSRVSSLKVYKWELYFLAYDTEEQSGLFKLNGNEAVKVCNFVSWGNDALDRNFIPYEYKGDLYVRGQQKFFWFNGTDCFKVLDTMPIVFKEIGNKVYFSNSQSWKYLLQEYTWMGDVMTYNTANNILFTKDIASWSAFSGKILSINATIPEGTSYSAQYSANKSSWTNIATNFTGSLNTTKLQWTGTGLYIRITLNGTTSVSPVISSLNLE